jgi:hypothetical protein
MCADNQPGRRLNRVARTREVLRRLDPEVVRTKQIRALLYAGSAVKREKVAMSYTLIAQTEFPLLGPAADGFAVVRCGRCLFTHGLVLRGLGAHARRGVAILPREKYPRSRLVRK